MKLYNAIIGGEVHLCVEGEAGLLDLTKAGFPYTMNQVVSGEGMAELEALISSGTVECAEPEGFANVIEDPKKIVCVGLNYKAHAAGIKMDLPDYPVLFSKYSDALVPSGADIPVYPWESSYDYEGELVIVIGKTCFNVSEEEAMDCVFGYTIGNDLSLRDAQLRTSQWLAGKALPAFGPAGPCIVTKDSFDPFKPMYIRSYVNGEMRQDGLTTEMIFSVCRIISYASKYLRFQPGDLIYTGTPSGVALEQREDKRRWLEAGDVIDIEIEGIGTLTNTIVDYKG